MVRSFVAVDLPDSTKDALEKIRERLHRQVPHRSVRWLKPTSIHLTLKFLGDVAESNLPEIKAILAAIGQRNGSFTFGVGGLGCFPNVKRPRVVWVGVQEESGNLAALQRDVDKSLAALGFQREKRAFHPHLTLGRARRDVRSGDLRRLGEIIAGMDVGELDRIRAESFRLMRSDLRPDGAVYTSLAAFSLIEGEQGR